MSLHKRVMYPCNQCSYKAVHKSILKTHKISVHEGVRYLCNQCDYKAKWKSNLKTHERSVHESVKYLCNQCTVGYLSMAGLVFKEIERDTMYEQIPSMNTYCLI